MLLLFHIIVALSSLVAAGVVYASPSQMKLRMTYILSAAMLASGTVLVLRDATHLVKACVMGLSLLAVISYAVLSARSKLAIQRETNRR